MTTTTHTLPGLALTDHTFTVPLDHARPDGEQIQVFARAVRAVGKRDEDRPWLVFFQGGPGSPSPRPLELGGWIKRSPKQHSPPGVQTLWQGLHRLRDLATGWSMRGP